MEVTKENFQDVLPKLQKAIENSTFISIDCELTGLNVTRNIKPYDSPKTYYEKVRRNCQDFLVIQQGLSIFRYDKSSGNFKQQSYNFYIFRRPINRNIPDQRFLCQSSSIDFLISHGFDFNKLFKDGISYLNIDEESSYRKEVEESLKKRLQNLQEEQDVTQEVIPIPDDAQEFIDNVVKEIKDFLTSDEEERPLSKCRAFHRRLIYQIKEEQFHNKCNLETRMMENNDRVMFIMKFKGKKEQEEAEKRKYEEQLEELENFIGFTKAMRLIVDSGKPIVGHNICLDLLHTIDKYLTVLPEDYEEFKQVAHGLFSKVFDTKYISSNEPFKDFVYSTVLNHLLIAVQEKPFELPVVEIEDDCHGYNIDHPKEHEAGYDAYITGLCLLGFWKYLGLQKKFKDDEIFANLNLLEPYLNKVFLMTLNDNQYINLSGKDLNPSREHVFHLTFPKNWKVNNIQKLFSPFGNINVSWLGDDSAYVALYKRDQAANAFKSLSHSNKYTLVPFAKSQAAQIDSSSPFLTPSSSAKRPRSKEEAPDAKRVRIEPISGGFLKSKHSNKPIEAELLEEEKKSTGGKTFAEEDIWG